MGKRKMSHILLEQNGLLYKIGTFDCMKHGGGFLEPYIKVLVDTGGSYTYSRGALFQEENNYQFSPGHTQTVYGPIEASYKLLQGARHLRAKDENANTVELRFEKNLPSIYSSDEPLQICRLHVSNLPFSYLYKKTPSNDRDWIISSVKLPSTFHIHAYIKNDSDPHFVTNKEMDHFYFGHSAFPNIMLCITIRPNTYSSDSGVKLFLG